jgi:hypothetical protein
MISGSSQTHYGNCRNVMNFGKVELVSLVMIRNGLLLKYLSGLINNMTIKTYIHITEKRLGTDCLTVLKNMIKREMQKIDFPRMAPVDDGYNIAVNRLYEILS